MRIRFSSRPPLSELLIDLRWTDHLLPSRSRIATLLNVEKLTRRYQNLSPLPALAEPSEKVLWRSFRRTEHTLRIRWSSATHVAMGGEHCCLLTDSDFC
jgi:hypothetical protein